jgi:hypothetical protein
LERIGIKSVLELNPWSNVLAKRVYNPAALFSFSQIEMLPFRHTLALPAAQVDVLAAKISEKNILAVQFLKYLAQKITPAITTLHDRFVDGAAALRTRAPPAFCSCQNS